MLKQEPNFVTTSAHTAPDPSRPRGKGVKDYAIFMLDPGGNVSSWSPGAENIMGYRAEEVAGRHFACFYLPEDVASGLPERDLRVAREEGESEQEGQRLRKDGSIFRAVVTLCPVQDPGGKDVGFANVTRDITDRMEGEAFLRDTLERYRLLVEGIKDYAIFMLDPDGNILTWNSGAEEITGLSAQEAIGQNHSIYFPAEDVAAGKPQWELARAAAEGRLDREGWRIRKGGTPFWSNGILTALHDEAGNIRGFAKVISDLSERMVLEGQLHQSQKMDAFGQLAGGVAHDFNNILTVISGYSEFLLSEMAADDPHRSSIVEIQCAGERAASLTRQLLAFTRQQMLEAKIVDLNDLVCESEKMLQRLIGDDVQIISDLSPTLDPVKVDAGQIEQVLMNLVLNARDAMPEGGRITITTRTVHLGAATSERQADVRPGRFAVLTVTDSGAGMSPEMKARIFEPFFTTKQVGKGTGLGLAVVHGIIKQSDGLIEVESNPGGGTTFKVYLPAVGDMPPAPAGREPIEHPLGPALGTETILLLEDEYALRELIGLALQRSGYSVLKASSGPNALRLMAGHTTGIDLLVTDVVMPEMSGTQAADALQARFPGLKVLYMSGYMDDAVLRHGVLQDQVAFLQKPFTVASLVHKVRDVLDQ